MIYADDTQLIVSLKSSERENVVGRLEICLQELRNWMVSNHLKLNDSKMELLHVSSPFRRVQEALPLPLTSMIGQVLPSPSVCDLGVILDKNVNMRRHVNIVCRKASFALRRIGMIRSYLSKNVTEILIHAFDSSLLDNCNSLLYGTPDKDIAKLQRIQNSAARLVSRSKKHNHITPILKELHWLPIKSRIRFKVLLITFNAVHGFAPQYISELVSPYTPSRTLRSSTQLLIQVPRLRTKTHGERSFSYSAQTLWNSLPSTLRSQNNPGLFKSQLKTFLFNEAFN
nr:uncharacterized protein LOC129258279 [Lytechinus pictus]